jgi:hypothetical protein
MFLYNYFSLLLNMKHYYILHKNLSLYFKFTYLHIHASLPAELCYMPDQAACYHTLCDAAVGCLCSKEVSWRSLVMPNNVNAHKDRCLLEWSPCDRVDFYGSFLKKVVPPFSAERIETISKFTLYQTARSHISENNSVKISYSGVFTPCKNCNIETLWQLRNSRRSGVFFVPCRAEPNRAEPSRAVNGSLIESHRLASLPGNSYKHLDFFLFIYLLLFYTLLNIYK